jgi:hypothetical protein
LAILLVVIREVEVMGLRNEIDVETCVCPSQVLQDVATNIYEV